MLTAKAREIGTVPERAGETSPGGLISARYAIERLLGTGGMGAVFAAHDRVLGRAVALKVIRGPSDPADDERLVREARAMAKLSHPNVIPVFDVGIAASGPVYVAMELVDGVTLDRWLRERARDPAEIVAAFVAAARGLDAAHAAGLVHRDFKPENVIVGADGRVRVLDFGLARAAGAAPGDGDGAGTEVPVERTLTQTGAVAGTPSYMSPEQWRGEPTDARTDQFSLCVALAAALGGAHPFDDSSPAASRAAVLSGALRLAPAIPSAIEPVLRRGLASCRDDRFATMDELIAALPPPAASRRRWWLAAPALAIVVAAVSVAIWRASASSTPPAAAERRAGASQEGAWRPPDPSPPAPGFRCGPNFATYAVVPGVDSAGVRCVLFTRDRDGRPWLAWYGEGVHRGAHYRHVGEGRLGGAASVAEVIGNGEDSDVPFDDTLHLEPADAGTPPQRIAVGGGRGETWVRTDGLHADYTAVLGEPLRLCGPHFTRYRVYPSFEAAWGFSVACVTRSGRTWLSAGAWARDPFMAFGTSDFEDGVSTPIAASLCLPGIPCGSRHHGRHGQVTVRPRDFPGVGAGLELSGLFPELWFPWARRYAVRIHAVRVGADESPDDMPVTVRDVERAVRRANQLLAPAGIEVFFVADEHGPDIETLLRSRVDHSTRTAIEDEHPYKVVVFFGNGANRGCAPATANEAVSLPPPDSEGCATPWDDRLAQALAARLGLSRIPEHSLSPEQATRLEARLRDLLIE